jgi:RHH-type proline utilization regulon transcriptional repressor/proline dehydrogenase/delta 1-pyrroline-5-carboxylate dehydrogenase
VKEFRNEPILELRRAPVRAQLADALAAHDAKPPVRVPVWVGDERREGEELISTDPGAPDRVVAQAASATPGETEAALAMAASHRTWAETPAEQRAEVLMRAAQWLRDRRLEVAALEVREAAKPWPEADADVCEAIDFLEYYARGAVDLAQGAPLLQVPGERNELRYTPRGVVAVISPWNFPVAIPLGMVSAGLATGNAVILKPAEQTPGCAAVLVQALRESGVPPEALALLPGEGDVGAALVRDRRVHTIAFTGSNKVGLEIVRTAAEVPEGQRHLKRVVAEMGGKNAVIVDSDADLDEVVPALVASAFVFAGQKCSAAARVLAHESIHDALVDRLSGAVEVLQVGQASELDTDVPPVIEQEAQERVARYAAEAEKGGRIAAQAREVPDGGWFATPTLAADLPADSPVLNEEIFGPLLAVERV